MAASNLNLGKASGGVLNVQPADGTTTTSLVLPAINGTVVAADSNGNVGIGVTPSAWSSVGNIELMDSRVITTRGNINISSNGYYNFGWKAINTAEVTNYYTNNGGWVWQSSPSTTAGSTPTFTTKMTLDASGSLYVLSNLYAGWNGSSFNASNAVIAYGGSSNSYFQIIGKSTVTGGVLMDAYVGGSRKASITDAGSFLSATNSYGSTSDAKLKENIQDASPKLDKLMQVQVRTFNYIGQEDKQIGVVAQEIEKIFPSIVYETKDTKQVEVEKEREVTLEDGTLDIEKYTEMETVETGEVTKNVKYSVIYMMMLKAMQEQNEIIKDLKSRIEILEAK